MSNHRIILCCIAVVAGMLCLGLSAKPLYDTFCRVTGFGGTTRSATQAPERIIDRNMTVRFDANVAGAPIRFRAMQNNLVAPVGTHNLAFYEVENMSGADISIIANYNVTPHKAGRFFSKLECFCFKERLVKAGETRKLPVLFFIDPAMAEQRSLDDVRTITLSYTFFQADTFSGATQAALLE